MPSPSTWNLTQINFNENTSRNTTINNIELVKLDKLDKSLLYFGDIKVEKYSETLGVSRHISYNTKQHLAVTIEGVKVRWDCLNYLDIHDDSINFDRFQTKLQNCIDTLDVAELRLHLPDQDLINEIVYESIDSLDSADDEPNNNIRETEALRIYNLKDVVGSNYVTCCYGCPPCGILVNRQCSPVTKNGFFKCDLTIKLDSIFMTSDLEISLMGSIIGIENILS